MYRQQIKLVIIDNIIENMGTRYDLLREMREKQKIIQTGENEYNKLIQSGDLAKEHYDYGVGFYDVSISYIKLVNSPHSCRVYFNTIDDGDFGSWNDFETKEEALNLLEKVVKKFEDITRLPSSEELNVMFREIGVYFCFE